MKRIVIFALIAVLLLGLCACGKPETNASDTQNLPTPNGESTPATGKSNLATRNRDTDREEAQEGVLRVYSLYGHCHHAAGQ